MYNMLTVLSRRCYYLILCAGGRCGLQLVVVVFPHLELVAAAHCTEQEDGPVTRALWQQEADPWTAASQAWLAATRWVWAGGHAAGCRPLGAAGSAQPCGKRRQRAWGDTAAWMHGARACVHAAY